MNKIWLAIGFVAVSQTAFAGNWNGGKSSDFPSTYSNPEIITNKSLTFVVPNDVMEKFNNTSDEIKAKSCKSRRFVYKELPKIVPPQRIKGFNSRMDNHKKVEGAREAGRFVLRFSELATSGLWNEYDAEMALQLLHKWADAGALTKTKNCFKNGDSCGSYWGRSDGQDKFAGHDISHTFVSGQTLAYSYYMAIAQHNPDDERHAVIQKWLGNFIGDVKKRKLNDDFYWQGGMHTGGSWIHLLKQESEGKINKKWIERILKHADMQLNNDGSIKERTTRGNRALHYHNYVLNEIVINMEIANRYNVEIPEGLHSKVQKAANIFIKGVNDHSYMDQWAKKAHNGVYKPGEQHFPKTIGKKPNSTSWWFIFQYRYAGTPEANELAEMVKSVRNPGVDGETGIGYGCIYNSILTK